MAIGTVTVTTSANWAPTVWATELSDASQAWTGLSSLVDRQYEDELSVGKTVTIPDRANPAVRFKTADTSATYSNVTETTQNITVNVQNGTGDAAYWQDLIDSVIVPGLGDAQRRNVNLTIR